MKKIMRNLIIGIGAILKIALLLLPWIINDLCSKKAGVMHHVYYRKVQYFNGIYRDELLNIQIIVAIIIGAIFINEFRKVFRCKKYFIYKIELILGIIASLSMSIISKNEYIINKVAAPYFIMALEIFIIMQFIICMILKFKFIKPIKKSER